MGEVYFLTPIKNHPGPESGAATMATALDVAAYILQRQGSMTSMKLQKLVYYCQAWSLVWDEEPLFKDRIQAWANGPVVPRLYEAHKGQYRVSRDSLGCGDPSTLTANQKDTIRKVLEFYGKQTAKWLIDLTHLEAPWKDARGNLRPGISSTAEITHEAMAEYYSGLQ